MFAYELKGPHLKSPTIVFSHVVLTEKEITYNYGCSTKAELIHAGQIAFLFKNHDVTVVTEIPTKLTP